MKGDPDLESEKLGKVLQLKSVNRFIPTVYWLHQALEWISTAA